MKTSSYICKKNRRRFCQKAGYSKLYNYWAWHSHTIFNNFAKLTHILVWRWYLGLSTGNDWPLDWKKSCNIYTDSLWYLFTFSYNWSLEFFSIWIFFHWSRHTIKFNTIKYPFPVLPALMPTFIGSTLWARKVTARAGVIHAIAKVFVTRHQYAFRIIHYYFSTTFKKDDYDL